MKSSTIAGTRKCLCDVKLGHGPNKVGNHHRRAWSGVNYIEKSRTWLSLSSPTGSWGANAVGPQLQVGAGRWITGGPSVVWPELVPELFQDECLQDPQNVGGSSPQVCRPWSHRDEAGCLPQLRDPLQTQAHVENMLEYSTPCLYIPDKTKVRVIFLLLQFMVMRLFIWPDSLETINRVKCNSFHVSYRTSCTICVSVHVWTRFFKSQWYPDLHLVLCDSDQHDSQSWAGRRRPLTY